MVTSQWLETSCWSPNTAWWWHCSRGNGDHPSQVPETDPLWKNGAVHRLTHDSDPISRENSGGTGQGQRCPHRCTAMPRMVYTVMLGDHPEHAALGHVLVGTALGEGTGGWRCHPDTTTSSLSCKLCRVSIHCNSSCFPQAMLLSKCFLKTC
jgi:hypothetical protein